MKNCDILPLAYKNEGDFFQMIPAILLFALAYVLMLVFSKYRPYIALVCGAVFV